MPHINELYDYTITVFIVYRGKVLLVNHPRYDKWIPMGGHIELDEDPETALYREIQEETGLDVKILSSKPDFVCEGTKAILTPNFVDVHEANPPHKHTCFIYFASTDNEAFVLSDEHDDMKWFSLSELEEPAYKLSVSVKFYCREAIELAEQTLDSTAE